MLIDRTATTIKSLVFNFNTLSTGIINNVNAGNAIFTSFIIFLKSSNAIYITGITNNTIFI